MCVCNLVEVYIQRFVFDGERFITEMNSELDGFEIIE